MAIFKPFRGSRESLKVQPLHDGYAYFCIDDGTFHIDFVDADGKLQRKQLNAKEAESLTMRWDTQFIFDGGDADVQLAVLDETILL